MNEWKKIIFCILMIAVLSSSANLGRSLWMQYKEQAAFISLKKNVERVRVEKDREENKTIYESEIVAEKREILPEYESLAKKNSDFTGWITIEGTRIDYPVMQVIDDREYYLHRSFEGKDSYAGVPFVGNGDLREGEGNIFIYGHNMRNGSMFADLLKYQQKDFWEQHRIITLNTLYEQQKYEIFTAFYTNENEWNQENSPIYAILKNDKLASSEDITLLAKRGLYDSGIIPAVENSFLFLVTCSYQEKDGRFIVGGVQIR